MVDQHDENHEEKLDVTTGEEQTATDNSGDILPENEQNNQVAEQGEHEESFEKLPVESPVFQMPESELAELDGKMDWYILKVQVNREDVIKESLKRKVQIAGMDQYFDQIVVPSEKVTEVRGGKKRIVRKKLYPGYIMIRMVVNDDTWFLVRETSGIGDFTGAAGRPTPMLPHEVERILVSESEDKSDSPKLKIPYEVGNKVKIKDGTFVNFEGEVHGIDSTSGRVTVMLSIFGRSTPVELEYWQVELLQ